MSEAHQSPKDDQPGQPASPQFQRDLEQVIQSYAEATEAGRTEEATQAALRALIMAAGEAIRNPTPDLKLAEEADRCESVGDWAGAEKAYRQRIASCESSDNPGLKTKPQMDLSRLLRLTRRLDEAWELALAATASARLTEIPPLLAMALENLAWCALERGDTEQAVLACSEALGALDPNRLNAPMRARLLSLRAECLLARADVPGAEADLKASWELLGQTVSDLPGPAVALARWWEVRAKLDLQAGKLSQAGEALTKAIQRRRQAMEIPGTVNPYLAAALARNFDALSGIAERRGFSMAALDASLQAKLLREEAHLPVQVTGPSL